MRLLFEQIAKQSLGKERVEKYARWVNNAEKARMTGSLDKEENQYDKAEELITFYSLAPLLQDCFSDNDKKRVVKQILEKAGIDCTINSIERIDFETCLPPPAKYLQYLKEHMPEHPIAYIRSDAGKKVKLEGLSHIDALIETDNMLILFEYKFTSEISPHTKFGVSRNQLARVIDVGIEQARGRKKLVVLLCSPSKLFNEKNRLYYYKIKNYADMENIKADLPWRDLKEITDTLIKVGWVSLEDVVSTVYSNPQCSSDKDSQEAKEFFRERILMK